MTDFGDSPVMGLRDIAAFCENFRGCLAGPTRVVQLADYRDMDDRPVFAPLIRALVMT